MLDDFCGFTFNQHHSSEMGFIRVSDGNRYNINLVPSFNDKTTEITGGDGVYFFESLYTSQPFSISIAFDSMTETQLRTLRQVFNGKNVGELIFDELPYKAYIVKVQSPPQIKYICFNEGGSRIYKGEGTIQFIAYLPYAQSTKKFINEYSYEDYPNKDEWKESSGMIDNLLGTYDLVGEDTNLIRLYNPGDLDTDFKVYLPISTLNSGLNLRLTSALVESKVFNIKPITGAINNSDVYICINTKTNLIEGCNSLYESTGSLYNSYISSGDFFKIPVYTDTQTPLLLTARPFSAGTGEPIFAKLEYNYLYY